MEAALQDAQSRDASTRQSVAQLKTEAEAHMRASSQAGAAAQVAQAAANRAHAAQAALAAAQETEAAALRRCKEVEQEVKALRRRCEELQEDRALQEQEVWDLKRHCKDLEKEQLVLPLHQQQEQQQQQQQSVSRLEQQIIKLEQQLAEATTKLSSAGKGEVALGFSVAHVGCQVTMPAGVADHLGTRTTVAGDGGDPDSPVLQLTRSGSCCSPGWAEAETIAEQLRQQQDATAEVIRSNTPQHPSPPNP